MASITINLEPAIKERRRVRAAHQGRSMEAEARAILETALTGAGHGGGRSLYERIHGRFAAQGGVELELPPRDAGRPPRPSSTIFVLDTNVLSELLRPAPADRSRPG